MASVKRRTYRSSIRRGEAPQLVCAAAQRLFSTKGYLATSIEDIAAEAGVARPTVFTAVGTKPVILKAVLDQAMAGDDAPVPIAERPWFTEAELALHNGDPAARIAMWSRTEPLTLFGAARSGRGWAEIGKTFEALGQQFSNCTSYENEIVAAEASGDLAYTVALEHTTASINGAPPRPYVLRATTIFRREDGEWKVVLRHADALASDSGEVVGRLANPG